jgi:hypothetical protein
MIKIILATLIAFSIAACGLACIWTYPESSLSMKWGLTGLWLAVIGWVWGTLDHVS